MVRQENIPVNTTMEAARSPSRPHLLGHGEGGHGGRRGKGHRHGPQLHAPEPQRRSHGQGRQGQKHQLGQHPDADGPPVGADPLHMERGAQADEGHRRGGGGQAVNRVHQHLREAQSRQIRQQAQGAADDEGIGDDLPSHPLHRHLSALEHLQGQHRQHIIHRHRNGHHNGHGAGLIFSEQDLGNGHAHQGDVSPEHALEQGAPLPRLPHRPHGHQAQDREAQEHQRLVPQQEGHVHHLLQVRLEGAAEQLDGQQHLEHQGVDLLEGAVGKEVDSLEKIAQEHHEKDGGYRVNGYDKAFHCVVIPFCVFSTVIADSPPRRKSTGAILRKKKAAGFCRRPLRKISYGINSSRP